jgi:hypothetical protein
MIIIDHDYHVVELNSYSLPDGIYQWLEDQFGPGDGSRWFYKHPKIYFANPNDHLMFLLRVSHD